ATIPSISQGLLFLKRTKQKPRADTQLRPPKLVFSLVDGVTGRLTQNLGPRLNQQFLRLLLRLHRPSPHRWIPAQDRVRVLDDSDDYGRRPASSRRGRYRHAHISDSEKIPGTFLQDARPRNKTIVCFVRAKDRGTESVFLESCHSDSRE